MRGMTHLSIRLLFVFLSKNSSGAKATLIAMFLDTVFEHALQSVDLFCLSL
jgi:hypothetical protein